MWNLVKRAYRFSEDAIKLTGLILVIGILFSYGMLYVKGLVVDSENEKFTQYVKENNCFKVGQAESIFNTSVLAIYECSNKRTVYRQILNKSKLL